MKPGVIFKGERIPLINPQRGIFKPQQKTVFPKPGGKVWYDDQREVHRQIFEGDETVWLREAFENSVPISVEGDTDRSR